MKKITLIVLILFLCLSSACAGGTAAGLPASTATGTGQPAGTGPAPSQAASFQAELQLLLGTFKLEGTDLAVTPGQAEVLLPLWRDLEELDDALDDGQDVQATIAERIAQVQAVMTPAQMEVISQLETTWEVALAILQERGIRFGRPQPTPTTTSTAADSDESEAEATPTAAASPTPSGPSGPMEFIPSRLLDGLVQLLQARTAGPVEPGASSGPAATPPADGPSPGSSASSARGIYRLEGGSDRQTGRTYSAFEIGESAVQVLGGASLILTDSIVTAAGRAASSDHGSHSARHAAVLVTGGSTVSVSNSQVTASGVGASGVLSGGAGSLASFSNVRITTSRADVPAVMATQEGEVVLDYVEVITNSRDSTAIVADRGSTISLSGSTVRAYGTNSAGMHSSGEITAADSSFAVTAAEAAVLEDGGLIALIDSHLTSSRAGLWGVLIYTSAAGAAQQSESVFTMAGGSLSYTAADGPLFYITNTTAVITLSGVVVAAASGTLLKAAGGSWGQPGSNGGMVFLMADEQALTGDLLADDLSSITAFLSGHSSLTGAINADGSAGTLDLTLDASSSWTVTADSHLTCLTDPEGISGRSLTNVVGNGHTVFYDAAACPDLEGQTYDLAGTGTLTPGD